jgi:hypothetical protein
MKSPAEDVHLTGLLQLAALQNPGMPMLRGYLRTPTGSASRLRRYCPIRLSAPTPSVRSELRLWDKSKAILVMSVDESMVDR